MMSNNFEKRKVMNINQKNSRSTLMLLASYFLFCASLCGFLTSCADLEYTEETTRDEEWTYSYYADGIKN